LAEKVNLVYDLDLRSDGFKQNLKKSADTVNKQGKKIDKSLGSTEKKGQKMLSSMQAIWAGLAAVITGAAVKMISELSKLGAEFADVQKGFRRMADEAGVDANKLLNDIRRMSKGTVSDLEIMKQANKALLLTGTEGAKNLPRLMGIATSAATELGESTEYMFESIVTGIGRQSKMILDNLGIIVEGEITMEKVIDAANKKFGEFDSTALSFSQKMGIIKTSVENAKTEFGLLVNTALTPFVNEMVATEMALERTQEELEQTQRYTAEWVLTLRDAGLVVADTAADASGYTKVQEKLKSVSVDVNKTHNTGIKILRTYTSVLDYFGTIMSTVREIFSSSGEAGINFALGVGEAGKELIDFNKIGDFFVTLFKNIKQSIKGAADFVTQFFGKAEKARDKAVKPFVFVEVALNRVKERIKEVVESSAFLSKIFEAVGAVAGKVFDGLRNRINAINDEWKEFIENTKGSGESISEEVDKIVDTVNESGGGGRKPRSPSSPGGSDPETTKREARRFRAELFDDEIEQTILKNEELLEQNRQFLEDKNLTLEEYKENERQIHKRTAEEIKAIEREKNAAILKNTQTAIGTIGDIINGLTELYGKNSSAMFEISKALASVEAVMNVATGVTKALATYPPPLSFAQAALVSIKGAVEIAKINSQQFKPKGFAEGGLVTGEGSGTSDSIPAMLSNGEFVMNRDAVQRIGLGNLQSLNNGVSNTLNQEVGGITINAAQGMNEKRLALAVVDELERKYNKRIFN
jgi:hypothetical protein